MSLRIVRFAAPLVLLVAIGCGKKEATGLPPAKGSGAPPLPVLPVVEKPAEHPPSAAGGDLRAGTGTIYARREAQLGPKVTGILSHIAVEEGDRVKKGQVLFRLDGSQASLAVEQAKAAMASAQVAYDSTKLDFGRATELIAKGAIAPASYDQAKAGHDRAVTGLDQARVALQMAQRQLADTTVTSPIDGVVTTKRMNVGETVTLMPPTVVVVVQDIDQLELRAKLPERALATVREGTRVRMTVASIGLTREVQIRRINPAIDMKTRTVEIVADVPNPDGQVRVGMLAEVSFEGTGNGAAPASASAPAPTPVTGNGNKRP